MLLTVDLYAYCLPYTTVTVNVEMAMMSISPVKNVNIQRNNDEKTRKMELSVYKVDLDQWTDGRLLLSQYAVDIQQH